MSEQLTIRESNRDDLAAIEALYPEAFPDEDLLPIVRALLADPAVAISLVATKAGKLAGNVIFTKCGVDGTGSKAALLAPLAVAPEFQRQGVGSQLVRAGVERMRQDDAEIVLVLGDPAYYGRFGFLPETRIQPPYPLPAEWNEAWQSISLDEERAPRGGKLAVPEQWLDPALWGP